METLPRSDEQKVVDAKDDTAAGAAITPEAVVVPGTQISPELRTFFLSQNDENLQVVHLSTNNPFLSYFQRYLPECETTTATTTMSRYNVVKIHVASTTAEDEHGSDGSSNRQRDPRFDPRTTYTADILDLTSRLTMSRDVFIKKVHVLDPNLLVQGKYPRQYLDLEPTHRPMVIDPDKARKWHTTVYSHTNPAYVESVAMQLVSSLAENNISPNYPLTFGVFNGVARSHYVEFGQEYEDCRMSHTFRRGIKDGEWDVLHLTESGNTYRTAETEKGGGGGDPWRFAASDNNVVIQDLNDLDAALKGGGDSLHNRDDVGGGGDEVDDGDADADIIIDANTDTDTDTDDDHAECLTTTFLKLRNTPVQLCIIERFPLCMEATMLDEYARAYAPFDRSLTELSAASRLALRWLHLVRRRQFELKWSAILMQVCVALLTANQFCSMVHNDLHCQNIMLSPTDQTYLHYRYDKQLFRVPTYGYIVKIIDYGRATFQYEDSPVMSNAFHLNAEAGGQYTHPDGSWSDQMRVQWRGEPVDPNPAFDLARLACSIRDLIYRGKHRPIERPEGVVLYKGQRETVSPLFNMLCEWLSDEDERNIMRFENFELYKRLARSMKKTDPAKQIKRPHFQRFVVPDRCAEEVHVVVYNVDDASALSPSCAVRPRRRSNATTPSAGDQDTEEDDALAEGEGTTAINLDDLDQVFCIGGRDSDSGGEDRGDFEVFSGEESESDGAISDDSADDRVDDGADDRADDGGADEV